MVSFLSQVLSQDDFHFIVFSFGLWRHRSLSADTLRSSTFKCTNRETNLHGTNGASSSTIVLQFDHHQYRAKIYFPAEMGHDTLGPGWPFFSDFGWKHQCLMLAFLWKMWTAFAAFARIYLRNIYDGACQQVWKIFTWKPREFYSIEILPL